MGFVTFGRLGGRGEAALCSTVHNAGLLIVRAVYEASENKVRTIKKSDFAKPSDFEPSLFDDEPPSPKESSQFSAVGSVKSILGI